MNFECHRGGIFEGLEQPQEVEAIDSATFSEYTELLNRMNKLV